MAGADPQSLLARGRTDHRLHVGHAGPRAFQMLAVEALAQRERLECHCFGYRPVSVPSAVSMAKYRERNVIERDFCWLKELWRIGM